MNALIFAAGKGTRLQPLTENKPKALVEICGHKLLEITIKKLLQFKINRIVINVHHFAEQIIDFINNNNFNGAEIFISDERNQLLDTGGGLLKAKDFFIKNKPVIIHNVDIISNVNFFELIDYHNINKNLVSLFVQNRKSSRYLLLDDDNRLCGWQNTESKEEIFSFKPKSFSKFGYSGIHVIDYELFSHLKPFGVFSIIPEYLRLSSSQKIYGWVNNDITWFDIGTPEKLIIAEKKLKM